MTCAALFCLASADPLSAQGRSRPKRGDPRLGVSSRQAMRELHEPAFARGYADGYEQGVEDGRSSSRYDPVASRAYRSGDPGYTGAYGSRDGYKTNYRAGFRRGYEDGYRARTR